jgi:hypothetical protein
MAPVIRPARPDDAPTIHGFILELATYEGAPEAVEVTPAELRAQLASAAPPFECLLAEVEGHPVGFAVFFPNYSTWRGRRGLYLEDGASAARSSATSRGSRASAGVRASSGPCSTGTRRRSSSTARSAPSPSTSGRCTG